MAREASSRVVFDTVVDFRDDGGRRSCGGCVAPFLAQLARPGLSRFHFLALGLEGIPLNLLLLGQDAILVVVSGFVERLHLFLDVGALLLILKQFVGHGAHSQFRLGASTHEKTGKNSTRGQ